MLNYTIVDERIIIIIAQYFTSSQNTSYTVYIHLYPRRSQITKTKYNTQHICRENFMVSLLQLSELYLYNSLT